jgi:hypothetical protein
LNETQWSGHSDANGKTETPCYSSCGTIKIPPFSKAEYTALTFSPHEEFQNLLVLFFLVVVCYLLIYLFFFTRCGDKNVGCFFLQNRTPPLEKKYFMQLQVVIVDNSVMKKETAANVNNENDMK